MPEQAGFGGLPTLADGNASTFGTCSKVQVD